jgi:hypothetical protein
MTRGVRLRMDTLLARCSTQDDIGTLFSYPDIISLVRH